MNPSNRLLSQSDVYKVFRPLRVENSSLFWSQNMILGVFDMSKWWYLIWYRHFFPWRSYKNRPLTCPPLYIGLSPNSSDTGTFIFTVTRIRVPYTRFLAGPCYPHG
jgi:hypothetical protein